MVLSSAIRRAATRVVPFAVRSTARYLHCTQRCSSFFPSVGRPSENLFRSLFFPVVNRYSTNIRSDDSLLRVIEAEIECAVESHAGEEAEVVPPEFPFEIEDEPGKRTITLERSFQGENITVEVGMPDLVTGEENDNNNASGDDEERETANQSSLPIIVRVTKKSGGPVLEFGCTAYPDEIAIDSLSVRAPEVDEDQIPYEGPEFADLDENLQKSFHKYLEIRGIKPSTTNFLHGYMVDKDAKEYITWLKNIQKFVEA